MAEDLKKLMEMAQDMQESMKKAHNDLTNEEYTGEAGGGLVSITTDGRYKVKRVILNPKVREDLDLLPELIAAAFNKVVYDIEKASEKKMFDLTKKLGIPGLTDKT